MQQHESLSSLQLLHSLTRQADDDDDDDGLQQPPPHQNLGLLPEPCNDLVLLFGLLMVW